MALDAGEMLEVARIVKEIKGGVIERWCSEEDFEDIVVRDENNNRYEIKYYPQKESQDEISSVFSTGEMIDRLKYGQVAKPIRFEHAEETHVIKREQDGAIVFKNEPERVIELGIAVMCSKWRIYPIEGWKSIFEEKGESSCSSEKQ